MTVVFTLLTILALIVLLAWGYIVALMIRYPKPVHADEFHTIDTPDGWKIRLYRRRNAGGKGEPVFMCHSMASNHLNFELPPDQSLVDTLAEAGYDCWLIDLRCCATATPASGHRRRDVNMDDFLLKDIPAALAYIREATGHEKVHWIGHSMGGMLLYSYEAVFGAAALASGVAVGAPVGFEGVPYKSQPQTLFLVRHAPRLVSWFAKAMAPLARTLHIGDRYLPVNWGNLNDKIDTGAFLNLFELPPAGVADEMDWWASNHVWRVNNNQVDVLETLPRLKVPLLAVYGAADPFIPRKYADEFFSSIKAKDKDMLMLSRANGYSADYNHIDLMFAPNSREELFLPILDWLEFHPITPKTKARSTAKTPTKASAPKKTAAKKVAAPKEKAAPKRKTAARSKSETTSGTVGNKGVAAKKKAANKIVAKKPAKKATKSEPGEAETT